MCLVNKSGGSRATPPPVLPKAPDTPEVTDPAVSQAKDTVRRRAALAAAYSANIATTPMGLPNPGQQAKTLFGA